MTGITKDDLKNLLKEVKHEEMGHNNYYNALPAREVTSAINNPLTWIGLLATVLTFVGILIFFIYSSDSKDKDSRITGNTLAINKVQESQNETINLIVKMQGNQESISNQIGRNAIKLDNLDRELTNTGTTRFTNKDGDQLNNTIKEKMATLRVDFHNELNEIKGDIRTLDSNMDRLLVLQGKVDENTADLKDRGPIIEDVKARVRALEISNH